MRRVCLKTNPSRACPERSRGNSNGASPQQRVGETTLGVRLLTLRQAPGRLSAARITDQAGVTLIELLVVVTIIAMFAALVGPRLFRQVGRSRATAAKAQINAFQTALGIYKLDTGKFPTNEQGLQALRLRPEGLSRWDGPYLPQEIPIDPWGNPYAYKFPGEHGDEPDIISWGADGREGGEGEDADIVSWRNQ